ncbi:Abi family protein [Bifidobacterium goeldii]|nr:Abi family protein [Bifidobacterium goeldii]
MDDVIIISQAKKFCGQARFDRYLNDASQDPTTALSLCKWNHRFAGVLHEQIGYVEIAVRNAIDRQLRVMALNEHNDEQWTSEEHEPVLVSKLISKQIREARHLAMAALPGQPISHDDVLSKLMWGTWVKMIGLPEHSERTTLQRELWQLQIAQAFPNTQQDESGRQAVARNLAYLRGVRNKAAHFDNLYTAADQKRRIINASMYLLTAIDKNFARGWLDISRLRREANTKNALLDKTRQNQPALPAHVEIRPRAPHRKD